MTLTEVAEAILQCCPAWRIDSIRYLDEGDFCSAYVVNREWVFRFGKHDAARESLRREYCVLPSLTQHVNLLIPSPRIAGPQEKAGLRFVGYPFLPGPALSKKRYLSLDEPSRSRCAEQVAQFLTRLHAVDPAPALACGVPVVEYTARYSDVLARAREQLYPVLDEPERLFIERMIGGYLKSGDALAFRPRLLHGDLSPDHVLFDRASRSVSAIIDFGDLMIGDPAWDLVFIYEDYGLDFLSRLVSAYNEPDRAALLRRVYQLYLMSAVDWTLGCRTGNGGEFTKAVAQLHWMRIYEKRRRKALLSACGVAPVQ